MLVRHVFRYLLSLFSVLVTTIRAGRTSSAAAVEAVFESIVAGCGREQHDALMQFLTAECSGGGFALSCTEPAPDPAPAAQLARLEAALRIWPIAQRSTKKRSFREVREELSGLIECLGDVIRLVPSALLDTARLRLAYVGLLAVQASAHQLSRIGGSVSARLLSKLMLLLSTGADLRSVSAGLIAAHKRSALRTADEIGLLYHNVFRVKYDIIEALGRIHTKTTTTCIAAFVAAHRPLLTSLLKLDAARALPSDRCEELARLLARLYTHLATLAGAGKHAGCVPSQCTPPSLFGYRSCHRTRRLLPDRLHCGLGWCPKLVRGLT